MEYLRFFYRLSNLLSEKIPNWNRKHNTSKIFLSKTRFTKCGSGTLLSIHSLQICFFRRTRLRQLVLRWYLKHSKKNRKQILHNEIQQSSLRSVTKIHLNKSIPTLYGLCTQISSHWIKDNFHIPLTRKFNDPFVKDPRLRFR